MAGPDDLGKLLRRRYVSVSPTDSVLEAEALMRMARLRAVPVVENGELLGMLSYRCMARRCLEEGGRGVGPTAKVTSVMNAKPAVVSPDLPLEAVVGRLVASREGCMPVVETGGKRLLGILTETDLLRAAYPAASGGALT